MTIFQIFSVKRSFDKFCFRPNDFFGKINFLSNGIRSNGVPVKCPSSQMVFGQMAFDQPTFRSKGVRSKKFGEMIFGKVIQNPFEYKVAE
jgi:hypothetical protein